MNKKYDRYLRRRIAKRYKKLAKWLCGDVSLDIQTSLAEFTFFEWEISDLVYRSIFPIDKSWPPNNEIVVLKLLFAAEFVMSEYR